MMKKHSEAWDLMNNKDQLQLAFVLHSRPWRETSLLIDIFSQQSGKLTLCARGVRNKKSPKGSLLQPLSPLLLCWKGRGEMPTLTHVEPACPAIRLSGDALYSSFYINELMVRLLHRHDPHPELFRTYQLTLEQLSTAKTIEKTLRFFEIHLLAAIGYGLTLSHDQEGKAISEQSNYLLNIDGLFQKQQGSATSGHSRLFTGSDIISIAENNWQNTAVLRTAKRLLRLSLQPLLGDKPVQSRKLFRRKSS